jgi:hypothetical protein
MKTSRLAIYWTIALLTLLAALYHLAQEPQASWPINLIHLLTKYKCK